MLDKKLAREELTFCKELASDESIVSISYEYWRGKAGTNTLMTADIPCRSDSTFALRKS